MKSYCSTLLLSSVAVMKRRVGQPQHHSLLLACGSHRRPRRGTHAPARTAASSGHCPKADSSPPSAGNGRPGAASNSADGIDGRIVSVTSEPQNRATEGTRYLASPLRYPVSFCWSAEVSLAP
jgi:hypothetical protein